MRSVRGSRIAGIEAARLSSGSRSIAPARRDDKPVRANFAGETTIAMVSEGNPATFPGCAGLPGVRTVRVLGASLIGAGAELVTVEARFDRRERDRTEVVLTGLPDPVLRESKGRL